MVVLNTNYTGTMEFSQYYSFPPFPYSRPQLNSELILHLTTAKVEKKRLGSKSLESAQNTEINGSCNSKMETNSIKETVGIQNGELNVVDGKLENEKLPKSTSFNNNNTIGSDKESMVTIISKVDSSVEVGTSPNANPAKEEKQFNNSDGQVSIEKVFDHVQLLPCDDNRSFNKPKSRRLSRKRRSTLYLESRTKGANKKKPQNMEAEEVDTDEQESSSSDESYSSSEPEAPLTKTYSEASTSTSTPNNLNNKKNQDPKSNRFRTGRTEKLIKIHKLPLEGDEDDCCPSTPDSDRRGLSYPSQGSNSATLFKGWIAVVDEDKLNNNKRKNQRKSKNLLRRIFGSIRTLFQEIFLRKKQSIKIDNSPRSNTAGRDTESRRSSSPLLDQSGQQQHRQKCKQGNGNRSTSNYNSKKYSSRGGTSNRIHPGEAMIIH